MDKVIISYILVLLGGEFVNAAGFCNPPRLFEYQQKHEKSEEKHIYEEGDKFYYKCDDGYHFKSNATDYHKVECRDRDWGHFLECFDSCDNKCKHPSQCAAGKCHCDYCGRYTGEFCNQAERCEKPKKPQYGSFDIVNVSGEQAGGCTVKVGTELIFVCEKGYQIERGSSSSTCTRNGWNSDVPVCERIICKPSAVTSLTKFGTYQPMADTYSPGKSVSFGCNLYYQLKGAPRSKCREEGYWSIEWPECVEMKCKAVMSPNGYMTHNGINYSGGDVAHGSILKFVCINDHVLDGVDHIECQKFSGNMRWSSKSPRCITREQCNNEGKVVVNYGREKKRICKKSSSTSDSGSSSGVDNTSSIFSKTGKPLTIVTGTAGGLLLLLLLVITIVACQRRRLSRMRRGGGRSGHRRLSGDNDRMSFVYYSNDVHVVLPSYDEAMQNRRFNFPPPYDPNEGASEETSNNAAVATTTSSHRSESDVISNVEENLYETIGIDQDVLASITENVGMSTQNSMPLPDQQQTVANPQRNVCDPQQAGPDLQQTTPNLRQTATNSQHPLSSSDAFSHQDAPFQLNPDYDNPCQQNTSSQEELTLVNSTAVAALTHLSLGCPEIDFRTVDKDFVDYTRYDGPPNEPIYARISELMRNDRSRAAAKSNKNETASVETGNTVLQAVDDYEEDFLNDDTEPLVTN